jgi:hypothetical protein
MASRTTQPQLTQEQRALINQKRFLALKKFNARNNRLCKLPKDILVFQIAYYLDLLEVHRFLESCWTLRKVIEEDLPNAYFRDQLIDISQRCGHRGLSVRFVSTVIESANSQHWWNQLRRLAPRRCMHCKTVFSSELMPVAYEACYRKFHLQLCLLCFPLYICKVPIPRRSGRNSYYRPVVHFIETVRLPHVKTNASYYIPLRELEKANTERWKCPCIHCKSSVMDTTS